METIWRVFKKFKIKLPYNLAILLGGICPKEVKITSQRNTCSLLFIAKILK
jgi:hypothetical protein